LQAKTEAEDHNYIVYGLGVEGFYDHYGEPEPDVTVNTVYGSLTGQYRYYFPKAFVAFAGSDTGGARAATIYTIIETAKLNNLDPEAISAPSSPASLTIQRSASVSCCRGV